MKPMLKTYSAWVLKRRVLGPDFPQGVLVVQDDDNRNPSALQNFKYVWWTDVVALLNLP